MRTVTIGDFKKYRLIPAPSGALRLQNIKGTSEAESAGSFRDASVKLEPLSAAAGVTL